MTRYVIVLPLVPMGVGDSFPVRRWPLHVTIVPSFESEATPAEIAEVLTEYAAHADPFVASVAGEELFGLSHTVPVNVLDHSPELHAAHTRLLDSLSTRLGIAVDSPHFTGEGYRPHVTATSAERAHRGDALHLAQFAVVDMRPQGLDNGRAVVATVDLAE